MFRITHNDAIILEHQVRRIYKCDRAGVSGMADADYLEGNPIQAAVLIVAYIHAHGLESDPIQFDEFLNKYETAFSYPNEYDMDEVMKNYIDDLRRIVDSYVGY